MFSSSNQTAALRRWPHMNLSIVPHTWRGSTCVCASHASSLGVQHLNEQVVAGHLSAQMHVAQVVLCLRAEGAELRQPHNQLAELLLELRVGGQSVLQQSPVHLLLDALHEGLVLQQLHICRHTHTGWTWALLPEGSLHLLTLGLTHSHPGFEIWRSTPLLGSDVS